MPIAHSPLRYPGGKQILSRVVGHIMRINGASGGTYVEPYVGGAGVALALLFGEHVERVLINDADPCIYAMWRAVLLHTDRFAKLLRETPTTVEEWARQRRIYQHPGNYAELTLGFATFYLNRCNRSGIIASGGPIGGQAQEGKWKIDARFNREELERRVRRIASFADRIQVSNADAIDFLDEHMAKVARRGKGFVYLDPPYYVKGRDLYLNHYSHADHTKLANYIAGRSELPWIMSYDNVPEIAKLYRPFRQLRFSLDYSARERHAGSEVMISRWETTFPKAWKRSIPSRFISAAGDTPSMPLA